MKRIFSISLFIFTCFLVACEEDIEGGLDAPVLEISSVENDRFFFTATIKEDGVNGKMYFLVETSDRPRPTAQELKEKPYVNIIDLHGRDSIKANMASLKSKTIYTVYAIIGISDQVSKVASTQFTTE